MLISRRIRNRSDYTLSAPAKLNLGLFVTGRRTDGYHLLESLFWPVSLMDHLHLSPSEHREVTCEWAKDAPLNEQRLPHSESNLVTRALDLVKFGAPSEQAWKIRIEKKIPMGAGLGGGSSDAGAVLRFLHTPPGKIPVSYREIADQLGADVPFFLNPIPSWVSGVGEICRPIKVDESIQKEIRFLVLLLPETTHTKDAFRRFAETNQPFSPAPSFPTDRVEWKDLKAYLKTARNDLESSAVSLSPLIHDALQQIRRSPSLYAGLSGTGSACFAVFDDDKMCEKMFQDLGDFCRKTHCRSVRASAFHL